MYRRTQLVIPADEMAALKDYVERYVDLSPMPGSVGSRITTLTTEQAESVCQILHLQPGARTMAVVTLHVNQQIPAHRDAFDAELIRYHVPITTNPLAWSLSEADDGTKIDWQHLDVGHVYALNPTRLHGAVNWGDQPRVHLMVDAERF